VQIGFFEQLTRSEVAQSGLIGESRYLRGIGRIDKLANWLPSGRDMSERRFVLVDFTYMSRARAIAHAASKRGLIAKERPSRWTRPSLFRPPETLTEAQVIEAEAELKALRLHALGSVDPE
jgi:hypothetical protein